LCITNIALTVTYLPSTPCRRWYRSSLQTDIRCKTESRRTGWIGQWDTVCTGPGHQTSHTSPEDTRHNGHCQCYSRTCRSRTQYSSRCHCHPVVERKTCPRDNIRTWVGRSNFGTCQKGILDTARIQATRQSGEGMDYTMSDRVPSGCIAGNNKRHVRGLANVCFICATTSHAI